jgi:hypothetical protein
VLTFWERAALSERIRSAMGTRSASLPRMLTCSACQTADTPAAPLGRMLAAMVAASERREKSCA